MQNVRKYVMTVAGLDPSGGAGILADIKTFEQHRVYGLSVCTAHTLQTENTFHTIRWTSLHEVLHDIDILMEAYPVAAVKTGIVPSFQYLSEIVQLIKRKNPAAKIVVDPVIRSSTGFDFIGTLEKSKLEKLLRLVTLLTPNAREAEFLSNEAEPMVGGITLSNLCPVLLKGGHLQESLGYCDHLFVKGNVSVIHGELERMNGKHGSGCVLSAAITANLTLGMSLEEACVSAKLYTEKFLSSNQTQLGYHYA